MTAAVWSLAGVLVAGVTAIVTIRRATGESVLRRRVRLDDIHCVTDSQPLRVWLPRSPNCPVGSEVLMNLGYQLPASIKICDTLTASAERFSCARLGWVAVSKQFLLQVSVGSHLPIVAFVEEPT